LTALLADDFRGYRLHVGVCADDPVDLSHKEIRALAPDEHVALHHCMQGWSGVAQWAASR